MNETYNSCLNVLASILSLISVLYFHISIPSFKSRYSTCVCVYIDVQGYHTTNLRYSTVLMCVCVYGCERIQHHYPKIQYLCVCLYGCERISHQ